MAKQLGRKLRSWQNSNARFVVLHDKDSANCAELKQKLREMCKQAGRPDALVRIVCHERWYLGDLKTGLQLTGLNSRTGSFATRMY